MLTRNIPFKRGVRISNGSAEVLGCHRIYKLKRHPILGQGIIRSSRKSPQENSSSPSDARIGWKIRIVPSDWFEDRIGGTIIFKDKTEREPE